MEVSKNDRLINFVIDTIAYSILAGIFSLIPLDFFQSFYFPGILYFLYYFVMEITINQTLGKLLTKTKVTSAKNRRPNVFHIFARTVLRRFPFDTLSYLMGSEQGIHDILSQTRLVKIEFSR